MTTRRRNPIRLAACAGAVLLLASAVGAQTPGQPQAPAALTPPRPRTADRPPYFWTYFIVAPLIIGVAAGAALIPSKRGHQD